MGRGRVADPVSVYIVERTPRYPVPIFLSVRRVARARQSSGDMQDACLSDDLEPIRQPAAP